MTARTHHLRLLAARERIANIPVSSPFRVYLALYETGAEWQDFGECWGRRGVPGDANALAPKPLAFVEAEERLEVRELVTRS